MRSIIALFLTSQLAFGCETATFIWSLPRGADPLFRFERGNDVGFINATGKIVLSAIPKTKVRVSGAFFSGMLSLGVSDGPFIDTRGRVRPFKEFDRVWDFQEGLAPAIQDFTNSSRWGYIDRSGAWAISPRFPSYPAGLVTTFLEGLASIETEGKVGFIDKYGEFAIPQQFAHAGSFSESAVRVIVSGPCVYRSEGACGGPSWAPSTGPEKVRGTSASDCRWSFVDRSGRLLSDGTFEDAQDFHDGLAAVRADGKWGYIGKQGSFIVAPRFAQAGPFSEGMALVTDGESSGYIDKNGKMQFLAKSGGAFSAGLAFVGDYDHGFVYVDKRGKQIIQERFEFATDFQYGLAHVKLIGKRNTFAYIDLKGKHIFTYQGQM
ncbi:MAG: WG repeat-containing protein [Acidobacteriota bacterium]